MSKKQQEIDKAAEREYKSERDFYTKVIHKQFDKFFPTFWGCTSFFARMP